MKLFCYIFYVIYVHVVIFLCKVDKIGFEDTQDTGSHPSLTTKYKLIMNKFGIDWPAVTWQDVTKPLYSVLAARLKLSNVIKPIPSSISEQGSYWKLYYNSVNGSGTEEKFNNDVNTLEKGDQII